MLDTTATRILPDKRLTDGTFFSKFTNLPTSRIDAFVLFLIISVFHGGKSCPPFCATSNFLISQNLSNISEQSSASSTNAHFCPKTHKSAQDDLCHVSSSARLTAVYSIHHSQISFPRSPPLSLIAASFLSRISSAAGRVLLPGGGARHRRDRLRRAPGLRQGQQPHQAED